MLAAGVPFRPSLPGASTAENASHSARDALFTSQCVQQHILQREDVLCPFSLSHFLSCQVRSRHRARKIVIFKAKYHLFCNLII